MNAGRRLQFAGRLGLRCGFAATYSWVYYDRVPSVINSGYAQDYTRDALVRRPLRNRKQAIKIYMAISHIRRSLMGPFFTSRGLLEAMLLFWVCCCVAAFEPEANGELRPATGGQLYPNIWLSLSFNYENYRLRQKNVVLRQICLVSKITSYNANIDKLSC
mgnify:CR=1 FL=1